MTVDLYDLTPPPIPDLGKLWVDFGQTSPSTTSASASFTVDDAPAKADKSNKYVADKLKDVSSSGPAPSNLLALKLAIFKDIIVFFSDNGKEKYQEIMADLQSGRVEKFAIDHRLKRALQGKDAANEKYKQGDRLGAVYTYAVAWSLLLPYHPDAYPRKPQSGRDFRAEIGKAECALFSNMSAMALMQVKDSGMCNAQKDALCQIGVDASEVCISLTEYITAGLMAKSCRRAKELCEKIKSREIAPDRLRFFKEQQDLLAKVDGDKMFTDLPKNKRARPATI